MNLAKCRFCGNKIPKHVYANALFCGSICRKRYYDVSKRPNANKTALKSLEGVVENRGGKYD